MKQKTIIVGTDFSKGSYVALELAVDIAKKIHADIQLIWVCREKMLYTDDQNNYVRNLATQKMDDLCEKYQAQLEGTTITPMIMQGKVAPMLAAQAEKANATMIVIGTNGASGFEKYWMGSTAVRIVQEATCPVLSIREGFNFHKSLERILVPLNMSTNSRQKLPVAVKMAKAFNAHIHLLGQYENNSQAQTVGIYMKQAETFLQKQINGTVLPFHHTFPFAFFNNLFVYLCHRLKKIICKAKNVRVRVARGGVSCPSRASMRRQGARDLTPIGSRNRYPFRDTI